MRKMLAILTLAFAALLAVPGAASAYGGTGDGNVRPGTVTDGGKVTFGGCGFTPGATVDISVDGSNRGTATAGSDGCVSTDVTVNGTGNSVLCATAGSREVCATVRVLSASVVALPRTGADGTAALAWGGLGLLGVGAALVAMTVSRRRTSPTTTV